MVNLTLLQQQNATAFTRPSTPLPPIRSRD
jgi:hypothetical protein